jgi:NADH-quinone oxidoreductase subunit B
MPVQIEKILGFGRSFSFWPLLFGLACCAIEMMALGGSRFDMSRFGMEAMRASPRQADGMIVAGWCSTKMAPRVVRLYEQIPDPKWVLAMGSCAISGNIWNTYNIVQGVDSLIPVDVYVPGCPPRPEALWQGLEMIRDRIKQSRHAYDGLRRIPAREVLAATKGEALAMESIWTPDSTSPVDRPLGLACDYDPATVRAETEAEGNIGRATGSDAAAAEVGPAIEAVVAPDSAARPVGGYDEGERRE